MSHNMTKALRLLNTVADVGFPRSPEDQAKRKELITGLFFTKKPGAVHPNPSKEDPSVQTKHEG